jgi:hypothetical protein
MKDYYGDEIQVGDYVICAMRKGDTAEIAEADVLEVFPDKIKVQRRGLAGYWNKIPYKASWWKHPDRVIIMRSK